MTRLLLFLAVIAAGCASSETRPQVFTQEIESILDEPARVELLTLHPYPHQVEPEDGGFHGYEVLGRADLSDAASQGELFTAIAEGIQRSDGTVAACFNPRHGIRVEGEGGSVEFVICYECLSMNVHGPAGRVNKLTVSEVQGRVDTVFAQVGLRIHAE